MFNHLYMLIITHSAADFCVNSPGKTGLQMLQRNSVCEPRCTPIRTHQFIQLLPFYGYLSLYFILDHINGKNIASTFMLCVTAV